MLCNANADQSQLQKNENDIDLASFLFQKLICLTTIITIQS